MTAGMQTRAPCRSMRRPAKKVPTPAQSVPTIHMSEKVGRDTPASSNSSIM